MTNLPGGIFSTGLIDNIFNTHRDLVAQAILDRFTDLIETDGGIVISSISDTGLKVVATSPYDGTIRINSGVAYDKFGNRIVLDTDDTGMAIYVGTVNLSGGIDLSSNKRIKINIDNSGSIEIDCSSKSSDASDVSINEIVASINDAGFGTIAYRSDSSGNPDTGGGYISVKSLTTGIASKIEFSAPSSNDATNEIFGLNESSYPYTYTGGGGYSIPADSNSYNIIIEHMMMEGNVGNFAGGYPTGSNSRYTQQEDSYKVSVTLLAPANSSIEHEILLAKVINDGNSLNITDKRGDSILYIRAKLGWSPIPPTPPIIIDMTTDIIDTNGSGT